MAGALSPLTKGHVPESVQILFSAGSIMLSVIAVVAAILDSRRMRHPRKALNVPPVLNLE